VQLSKEADITLFVFTPCCCSHCSFTSHANNS